MRAIRTRLADLETRCGSKSDPTVIAFALAGASDDEITEVRTMWGDVLQPQTGDDVTRLVERAKALHPFRPTHILHFDYRREAFARLGGETLPIILPDDPGALEARP